MKPDTLEYGDLGLCRETEREVKELLGQWELKRKELELAKLRQSVNGEGFRRTFRDAEGNGGEVTMRIPPYLYHKLGSYYGYACWNDNDFCRNVLKHYPECRVVSRSSNPTIVVPDYITHRSRNN